MIILLIYSTEFWRTMLYSVFGAMFWVTSHHEIEPRRRPSLSPSGGSVRVDPAQYNTLCKQIKRHHIYSSFLYLYKKGKVVWLSDFLLVETATLVVPMLMKFFLIPLLTMYYINPVVGYTSPKLHNCSSTYRVQILSLLQWIRSALSKTNLIIPTMMRRFLFLYISIVCCCICMEINLKKWGPLFSIHIRNKMFNSKVMNV